MVEQYTRNGELAAEAALTDYHEQGGKQLDTDTRQGRRAFMVERYQDANPAPDNSDRTFNLDNKQDRLAYMAERMNGTELADAASQEDE
jgi:hypothetical protein